jgi:hypothetical protein
VVLWVVGKWAVVSPFTHRASLWVRNELFTSWDCQFQLASGFFKVVQYQAFPTAASELPLPHMGFSGLHSAHLSPRKRGNIPSVCLATSFVQTECNWLPSCARIWGSIPNSVFCSPGGLAVFLGWKWISCRAAQAGSRQRFCVCLCLVAQSSQLLTQALFLQVSALRYSWQDYRQVKAERWGQESSSRRFFVHMYYGGTSIPRCLQVSAIPCILF